MSAKCDDPPVKVTILVPADFDLLMLERLDLAALELDRACLSAASRNAYVAALLAAIMEGLEQPTIAEALIRLNGLEAGDAWRKVH